MTRKEILSAIEKAGGTWEPAEGVVLTDKKSSSVDKEGVDAEVTIGDHTFKFWLMGHLDGASEFGCERTEFAEMASMFEAAQKLAHAVGYDMPGARIVEVRPVGKANDALDASRLSGMVEAYEKLLVGRSVNLSS